MSARGGRRTCVICNATKWRNQMKREGGAWRCKSLRACDKTFREKARAK